MYSGFQSRGFRIPLANFSRILESGFPYMRRNTTVSSRSFEERQLHSQANRPFPSSSGPLFQNEGRCSALHMEIIFHSRANKNHFHKKGRAPSLILKVGVFGTRKRPIVLSRPRNKISISKVN